MPRPDIAAVVIEKVKAAARRRSVPYGLRTHDQLDPVL